MATTSLMRRVLRTSGGEPQPHISSAPSFSHLFPHACSLSFLRGGYHMHGGDVCVLQQVKLQILGCDMPTRIFRENMPAPTLPNAPVVEVYALSNTLPSPPCACTCSRVLVATSCDDARIEMQTHHSSPIHERVGVRLKCHGIHRCVVGLLCGCV